MLNKDGVSEKRLLEELELLRKEVDALKKQNKQLLTEEEALRKSENYYRILVDYSPLPIIIRDKENLLFANKAAVSLFASGDEEVLFNTPIDNFIHPDYHHKVAERARQILEKNESVPPTEVKLLHSNGTVIDAEIVSLPIAYDDKIAIQSLIYNLTERKLAERKLLETSDKLFLTQLSVDMFAVPIVWLLSDGRISYANHAFSKLIGSKGYEAIEKTIYDINPNFDRDSWQRNFEELKIRKINTYESTVKTSDNRIVPVEIHTNYIFHNGVEMLHESIMDISDRKKAQEEIFQSKQMLRLILDTIPQGVFWKDDQARFLGINKHAASEVNIHEPDQVIGKTDFEYYPKELAEKYYADDMEVIRSGKAKLNYEELHRIDEDNNESWVKVNKVPLKDMEGNVFGLAGTFEDITIQRKTERQIKQISEELDQFFNVALELLCIADTNGNFRRLNITWERTLGFTREELMSKPFFELVHPDDMAQTYKAVEGLSSGLSVVGFVNRYRHKNGTYRWIEWRSASVNNLIYAAANDITERKAMEKALVESEERYRLIAENSSDLIWCMNLDRKFTYISPAIKRLRGFTPEEAMEHKIEEIMTPASCEKAKQAIANILESTKQGKEHHATIEIEEYCKDGSRIWTEVSNSCLFGQNNEVNGILGITRNISERKQFEGKLRKALDKAQEANKAKSQFIANMSHEIRTPMNAILGFAELLENKVTDTAGQEYIQGIVSGGKTLLNLINDILDLSKIESGKFVISNEPVNLVKLLNELKQVFSLQTKRKNLELIFEISPKIPAWLMLDELRLRQVLLNLLGNSVKFTNTGQIHLSVQPLENKDDNSKIDLYIAVKDTGIGIDEDQQGLIFEAFHQQEGQSNRKYGGTGLGLAITKRLVELMNGKIYVKSKPKKGSVFIVSLRNVSIASALDEENDTDDKNYLKWSFKQSTILLVDDVESNRRIIRKFLEPYPFVILEAESGPEAIEMAGKYKPQLILMDIQMNDMNGYEATYRIREACKDHTFFVLAVTALSVANENSKSLQLFDSVIQKPVSRRKLLSIFSKYLPCFSNIEEEKQGVQKPKNLKCKIQKSDYKFLQDEFLPQSAELIKHMHINDIILFASELNIFAKDKKIEELADYSSELLTVTHSFNVEQIESYLKNFNHILVKLNKYT
jgi:PAS domain S-box-containing protein